MSFPDLGGGTSAAASSVAAGMGIGGASTAGMSDQEAAMVKTVSGEPPCPSVCAWVTLLLALVLAGCSTADVTWNATN